MTPEAHRALLEAGTAFLTRIIGRYANRDSVIAWQVEHEAVDPLGMEHSWRLSAEFAEADWLLRARQGDPSYLRVPRPVLCPRPAG